MTCREFESGVVDLARGGPAVAGAAAHAQACPVCAERLERERALSAGLRMLAAADAGAEAPPRVEAALLDAFRTRQQARPALSGWRRWQVLAAVGAAAAALALWAVRGDFRGAPPTPSGEPVEARLPEPAAPVAVAEVGPEAAPPGGTALQRAPARPLRPARPATRVVELATEFIAVRPPEFSAGEPSTVVRVKLPRSVLASFGLPASGNPSEPVLADLLLGPDGTARAVRFVRPVRLETTKH